MVHKEVTLGIPDWVGEGLIKGDFVREGGVIRQVGNGKLVAFLPEIDARRLGMEELVACYAVPLVIQGVSTFVLERRLQGIEAKLALVLSEMRGIRAEQEYQSILAEAASMGRASGTLRAMLFDPAAGTGKRADHWIGKLMEHYGELSMAAFGMARNPRVLRRHPDSFRLCLQGALVVGVSARDLMVRLGRETASRKASQVLSQDAGSVLAAVEDVRNQPSSLFWIAPSHFQAISEVREADLRLKGHVLMHEEIPFRKIRRLKPLECA